MTLAEQWKKEGEEAGIAKGIEKGVRQEKIRLVSKLIKLKFRDQADEYPDNLNQLTYQNLEIIAERVLTAESVSDLFEGFSRS